jgi:hypothetical protein
MIAAWERPKLLTTDGESFSRIAGPIVRQEARTISAVNDELELAFNDPLPGAAPDVFLLRCVGADRLKVTYRNTHFEPFDFVRESATPRPLGPWDYGQTYVRAIVRPTNAEMTAIFEADQADRRAGKIDWSLVRSADEKRRTRTRALLEAGALQSGDDFYRAAFIYQHGNSPNDYLQAHLLAMIATARNNPKASWIASATLDRYLHAIGKAQVLGTQFQLPEDAPVTQEPYDRSLISDTVRAALHVPSISAQEKQRRRYTEKASSSKRP